jgi:hypothetical protein
MTPLPIEPDLDDCGPDVLAFIVPWDDRFDFTRERMGFDVDYRVPAPHPDKPGLFAQRFKIAGFGPMRKNGKRWVFDEAKVTIWYGEHAFV